jgi:polygalacturonase
MATVRLPGLSTGTSTTRLTNASPCLLLLTRSQARSGAFPRLFDMCSTLRLTRRLSCLLLTLRWEAFARNSQAGVAGGSSRVFARPIPLAVTYASRVTVRDIKIVQSPFWHSILFHSQDITFEDMTYSSKSYNKSAPPKNSDALDIYNSDRVTCVGLDPCRSRRRREARTSC